MSDRTGDMVIGLSTVMVACNAGVPVVLVSVPEKLQTPSALPFGPFDPAAHRTFEIAARAFTRTQTGFEPGYIEQLYTFGDEGREAPRAALVHSAQRVISVGYLGLVDHLAALEGTKGQWQPWYRFFPYEDHRSGRPAALDSKILPALLSWASSAGSTGRREARSARVRSLFTPPDAPWPEERVLDRYELLYEAGLTPEARHDAQLRGETAIPGDAPDGTGVSMISDHRRILATAIARVRAKIKYRPVVFELMPERFLLSQLQETAESLLGFRLHTANFRRALERTGLVAGTGAKETATGGRPAELFRYRGDAPIEAAGRGIATPRLK